MQQKLLPKSSEIFIQKNNFSYTAQCQKKIHLLNAENYFKSKIIVVVLVSQA